MGNGVFLDPLGSQLRVEPEHALTVRAALSPLGNTRRIERSEARILHAAWVLSAVRSPLPHSEGCVAMSWRCRGLKLMEKGEDVGSG